MDEKELDIMNIGKMAEAMWPHFVPMLNKKKSIAISKMKDSYNSGKTDASLYIAQVAVIAAFDEIISDIERQITRSRKKESDILNAIK